MIRLKQRSESAKVKTGVYTDLSSLLSSRHWARNLKLFSRQVARSMLLGETKSRFRGRGMEFEEVRTYQPGDDIRNIDWRVSARTGGTYTKLFCEERERPVHILLDQRSSMFFGSDTRFKSVMAAEVATAIAWAALAGSDRIGGQIIGDYDESDIRAKRNKQAVLRFIHDTNQFNRALPESPVANTAAKPNNISKASGPKTQIKKLSDMLEECRRITRPGTAIFVISDFHDFDQHCAKSLSTMGRHTDINLFHIIDPIEEKLPTNGTVSISDGKNRSSIKLSSKLYRNYLERLETRYKQITDSALRSRSMYTKILTNDSPRTTLTKIYGK